MTGMLASLPQTPHCSEILSHKRRWERGEVSDMIPAWNASLVLPPFIGPKPTNVAAVSPYSATMLELAKRFATSAARVSLLQGLIAYREAFLAAGISEAV